MQKTVFDILQRELWWPLIFILWNKRQLFYLQFQHCTVPKVFSPLTDSAIHHELWLRVFFFSFINYSLVSCQNKKSQIHSKTKRSDVLLRDWSLTSNVFVLGFFFETKLERSGYLTRTSQCKCLEKWNSNVLAQLDLIIRFIRASFALQNKNTYSEKQSIFRNKN